MKDQKIIRDVTHGTYVETNPNPGVADAQPGIRLGVTKTCSNCGCTNPSLASQCRSCQRAI